MSAHEIEVAIIRLTPQQLLGVLSWLEAYHTQASPPGFDYEQETEPLEIGAETDDLYATAD